MNPLIRLRRPFLAALVAVPGIAIAVSHCGGTTEHTQSFPQNHVPMSPTCPTGRPPGIVDAGSPADSGVTYPGSCQSDSDCTQGKNGRCGPQGHLAGNACTYDTCFSDGDCGPNKACLCSTSGNACVNANCTTDGECAGLGCSPSYGTTCGAYGGTQGQYCHTTSDECVDDKDCTRTGMPSGYCAFSTQVAHWTCFYSFCAG